VRFREDRLRAVNGADGDHAATLHLANYELHARGDDDAIRKGVGVTMFGIDIGAPMGHGPA
jgi:hypothetical protein